MVLRMSIILVFILQCLFIVKHRCMGVKFSAFKHHYQTGNVNYHYTKTSQDQD